MLCPNCKSWEVANGAADRYCSWCGSSWLNVECRAVPEVLYFSPRDREDLRFDLSLHNTGLVPLEILGVATEPLGCAFFSYFKTEASSAQARLALAPGETQKLSGHFHRAVLQTLLASTLTSNSDQSPGAPVRLVLMLADEQRGPETTLAILPRPEFELLTPTLEVLEEGDSAAKILLVQAPGRIRLRQGFAQVREVASEIAGITCVLVSHAQEASLAEEQNGVFDFHLTIERALVQRHLQSGQPLRTDLKLLCDDPPGTFAPFNASLQIIPRRVPRLTILGARRNRTTSQQEMQTWALAGQTRDFMLQLKNESEQTIALHAIEATGSLECLKRKALALPLRLGPRATMSLPFIIDAQNLGEDTIIAGALALRYQTAESSFTTECELRIDARVPKPYAAGVAALDFGSAQSCVAFAPLEDEPEARLLKIQNDPFVPTAIVYQNLEPNGARTYEIGYAALSAKSGKEAALHVVQDFKQHLGEEQSRQVYLTNTKQIVTLAYREIIADYLRGLMAQAEARLAEELFRRRQAGVEVDFSSCQLRDLVLAASTTFTFKQKEALRQLLAEIGVATEAGAQLVPAPVLSACVELETLLAHWQKEARSGNNTSRERHLLIYEMGAGATEIALVRVEMIPPQGATLASSSRLQVNLKVLGSEGDEQFGGNNLTSALAKYLAQQALAQLEAKFETKVVLPLWHRVGQAPGKRLEQVGYLNWKRLRRYAESLKCQFADLSLPARVTAPRLTLQILADKTFQAAHVEKLVVHSAMLERVVAARMDLHVRRVHNLLRHAKLQAPDRILLAGRSTLLPGVHKHLAGAFAALGCEVEFIGQLRDRSFETRRAALPSLHDLKAATALGGAKYLCLLKNSGAVNLAQHHRPMKTVMRLGLGLEREGRLEFLPVIEKNVEIGRECAAPWFALTWDSEIPIYAATKSGPVHLEAEAELIGRFTLMQFKPALPADLEEEALYRALQQGRLRLRLTRHRELQVLLRLRGREHAIYFELD